MTTSKLLSAIAVALAAISGGVHAETYDGVHTVHSVTSRAEVSSQGVAAAHRADPYADGASWTIPAEGRRALAEFKHVAPARPHFLSLGLNMLPSANADTMRARGLPVLAWTIRSHKQAKRVAGHCDNIIFEGFRPKARV